MNEPRSSTGGRRRKLETDPKAKTARKPKRRRGLGHWLEAGGRWLNQPLAGLPNPASPHPLAASLSRSRSIVPRYVRESWAEMRQVIWPRFGQAMRLTFAVVLFSAFFAVLVSSIDWMLTKIFEEIILNESQNIREFLRDLF